MFRRLINALRAIQEALNEQTNSAADERASDRETHREEAGVFRAIGNRIAQGIETGSDSAAAAHQEDYRQQERLISVQWWLFGCAAAAFAAAAIYAAIAAYEYSEMVKATKATQEAVQVAQLNGILGYMTAQSSLHATIDNFHLDQRAWVGIDTMEPFTIATSDSFGVRFNFRNTGRTPAFHVRVMAALRSLKKDEPFQPIIEPPKGVLPSDLTVFPNGTGFFDTPKYPLSAAQSDAVKTGRFIIYAYGTISYFDVFGKQHLTRFCKMLVQTNTAGDCHTDNTAN